MFEADSGRCIRRLDGIRGAGAGGGGGGGGGGGLELERLGEQSHRSLSLVAVETPQLYNRLKIKIYI